MASLDDLGVQMSPHPMTIGPPSGLGPDLDQIFKLPSPHTIGMAEILNTIVGFVAALIVSTLVIFIVAKLTGEKEGLMTALIAAIVGTVIYTLAYFILGNGLLAAALGGIVWLLALKSLYKIGWLKALLIAVIVWILTSIVGWFLPSLTGPL